MTNAIEVIDVQKAYRAKDEELVHALRHFVSRSTRAYLRAPGTEWRREIHACKGPHHNHSTRFQTSLSPGLRRDSPTVSSAGKVGGCLTTNCNRELLRFSLLGVGSTTQLLWEGAATVTFALVSLSFAVRALNRAD